MTLSDIATAVSGRLLKGDPTTTITSVSTDSRSVAEGDLFVPLIGETFDGHDYISSSAASGAAAILTAKPVADGDVAAAPAVVEVKDTLNALRALAASTRARITGPVAAVTGSNGKTSTKELMAAVLGPTAHKAPESFNNAIGVALTLLGVQDAASAVALEMGTNHFGEIADLVDHARPDIGVFLNAAAVHTEFLEDADGVAREKRALPTGAAHAVLNLDDPRVMACAADCAHVTTFGMGEQADVRATDVAISATGAASFSLHIAGRRVGAVTLRTVGRHQVPNALAAAAVGHLTGVSPDDIVTRLAGAEGAKMRMQVELVNGVTIINDAYNANPASVAAAFETFREMPVEGSRWVLLGDMLELGPRAGEAHEAAAAQLTPDWCAGFVPYGAHADAMAESAATGTAATRVAAILRCATEADVVDALATQLRPGDALLVKGSRGVHLETVVDAYRAFTLASDNAIG
jgi:UDP-N-acetylmuramoyl-tripeptide--D-alanyl-D-alanine ligase